MAVLTHERLLQLIAYDRATGVMTWRVRRGRQKAGSVAGWTHSNGYVRVSIDGVEYYVHCLAVFYMTGEWPKGDVDHRDLTRGHNWWSNLRPASRSQNQANKLVRKDSTTGIKGVSPRGDRFRAVLQVGGKRVLNRTFPTKDQAAAAYAQAAAEHFGEFARIG